MVLLAHAKSAEHAWDKYAVFPRVFITSVASSTNDRKDLGCSRPTSFLVDNPHRVEAGGDPARREQTKSSTHSYVNWYLVLVFYPHRNNLHHSYCLSIFIES